jgi:hypothetical protein
LHRWNDRLTNCNRRPWCVAMTDRAQHQCRNGSLAMVPTMSSGRSEMAGHVQPRTIGSAVAGCGGEPRRGAGAGGSHGPVAQVASSEPGSPLMMRALGLLEPVARNLIRFIEITIRFRRNHPGIPRPENEPFFFERRVPSRKSVIEEASRDGVPATVSSSKPMLGSQCLILR